MASKRVLGFLIFTLIFPFWRFEASYGFEGCQNPISEVAFELPLPLFNEISGLTYSFQTQRLYLLHDSRAELFYILFSGKKEEQKGGGKKIKWSKFSHKSFKFQDGEALAYGKCPWSDKKCIFIGDIGDNANKRQHLVLYAVEDRENLFFSHVRSYEFEYEDFKFQDAESLAVHPITQDIYILTKSLFSSQRLYRIERKAFESRGDGTFLKAHFIRKIDMKELGFHDFFKKALGYGRELLSFKKNKVFLEEKGFFQSFFHLFFDVATDMSFSPDGKNLILLSYRGASELLWNDVLQEKDIRFHYIDLEDLPQMESITYVTHKMLYYMSEYPNRDEFEKAQVFSLICQDEAQRFSL